jgi:two-component sensor histidine kinase
MKYQRPRANISSVDVGLGDDSIAILEALADPALLVAPDGTVEYANRAAIRVLGRRALGEPLRIAHSGDAQSLQLYLSRCLGSRQPLVGALVLNGQTSATKYPCRGSAVVNGDKRSVLLRLATDDGSRFEALSRKVAELNVEIRARRSAQAKLEEAVRERELLLRELQHRVKNNMHMLAGMLSVAARECTQPEAKAALSDAASRFEAVSTVQQLLYRSESLACVNTEELATALMQASLSVSHREVRLESAVDAVDLPADVANPLALILNELLTNALKHGGPAAGPLRLEVSLHRTASHLCLAVSDNGPGFSLAETRKRASGLGLIRGLVRQLSGRFTVEAGGGAHCAVEIPNDRIWPAHGDAM